MIQKWIFSIYYFLFAAFHINAQSELPVLSSTIPGQYIVQISNSKNLENTIQKIRALVPDSILITELMRTPLHLLLIKTKNEAEADFLRLSNTIPDIISAFPNRRLQSRATPNDPLLPNQWQYKNTGSNGGIAGADMDMYRAWDLSTGGVNYKGDTIVVCVVDDGVNGLHEDLKSNMWVNHEEIPDNGIDDDQNGYVDDYLGWNVKFNNDSLYNGGSHGTPVAGIIGAKGNNAIGVSGVNWNVKILPVNYGDATEANALASYSYAYNMRKLYNNTHGKKGAFIVATNSSWGIDNVFAEEAPIWCSLYDSLGSVGIISVAATTNKDTDVDAQGDLPTTCTSPYLITVTNLNNADKKVTGAGYGRKSIDLGAYGQQIFTINRTAYGTFGGTSAATPHVTGVIALLYASQCVIFDSIVVANPEGAARIARDMLLYGVVSLPSLKNITTSGGKINAFRALSNMKNICSERILPAGIDIIPLDNELKIQWIVGSETSIRLRYRKSDDQQWTVINNFKNGDAIPNLLYCTEYEVQISSNHGLLPGDYGYSTFIKTSGCCSKPVIFDVVSGIDQIAFSIKSNTNAHYLVKYYTTGLLDTIYTLIENDRFILEDVPRCHAFNFSIQSQCLNYGNESPFAEAQFITTQCEACTELPYCNDFINNSNQEWIASFSIGNQQFNSGQSAKGYSNFAGVQVFNLKKDTYYNFKATAGYKASSFAEHFKIFIDFNQDGIWTPDELVFKTTSSFRNELIDNIYIPASAKSGFTRMRLILSYENFDNACEKSNFEYGEVEDYCVWIEGSCDLNPTINIKSTEDTAIFSIAFPGEKPTKTSIYWRKESDPEGQHAPINDNIITLTNLDKCSKYNYYLKYSCVNQDTNSTVSASFKTACIGSTQTPLQNIEIYPNPAHQFLLINFDQSMSNDIYTLSATDILGHKVSISSYQIDPHQVQINIENLQSGMYFLKIGLSKLNQFTTIKFIRN